MKTTDRGRLEVEVTTEGGKPISEKIVVLLSENQPEIRQQYRFESKKGGAVSGELPAGPYTLQAIVKGYDAGSEFVQIQPDRTQKAQVRLTKKAASPKLPFTKRLEKTYGLKIAKESLQSLTVARGKKITLDYRTHPDSTQVQVLRPKSLKDLKRWVGSPEGVFVGTRPRFGPLPSVQGVGHEIAKLSKDQGASLISIANEYVYGNAQAIPPSQLSVLENLFSLGDIFVPIFYFNDVVIEDGAVLEIGNGSSVFTCDNLTIHPQGTLSAVGDVRADIGHLYQL